MAIEAMKALVQWTEAGAPHGECDAAFEELSRLLKRLAAGCVSQQNAAQRPDTCQRVLLSIANRCIVGTFDFRGESEGQAIDYLKRSLVNAIAAPRKPPPPVDEPGSPPEPARVVSPVSGAPAAHSPVGPSTRRRRPLRPWGAVRGDAAAPVSTIDGVAGPSLGASSPDVGATGARAADELDASAPSDGLASDDAEPDSIPTGHLAIDERRSLDPLDALLDPLTLEALLGSQTYSRRQVLGLPPCDLPDPRDGFRIPELVERVFEAALAEIAEHLRAAQIATHREAWALFFAEDPFDVLLGVPAIAAAIDRAERAKRINTAMRRHGRYRQRLVDVASTLHATGRLSADDHASLVRLVQLLAR